MRSADATGGQLRFDGFSCVQLWLCTAVVVYMVYSTPAEAEVEVRVSGFGGQEKGGKGRSPTRPTMSQSFLCLDVM